MSVIEIVDRAVKMRAVHGESNELFRPRTPQPGATHCCGTCPRHRTDVGKRNLLGLAQRNGLCPNGLARRPVGPREPHVPPLLLPLVDDRAKNIPDDRYTD